MKSLWMTIVVGVCAIACSSGEGAGNVGGAAGSSSGGSGGQCPDECFAPAQCVEKCGDIPTEYGCCGCPPGTIDAYQCTNDAGCQPTVPDAGTVPCGDATCTANQICVFHCCGGAPIDGSACKPAPPTCVEASSLSCTPCDGSSCSAPSESCTGVLDGQNLNCVCA